MKELIGRYNLYLLIERRFATNTVLAYVRDVDQFALFCQQTNTQIEDLSIYDIKAFLKMLYEKGLSASTRARKIEALRNFLHYAIPEQAETLCNQIVIPKKEERLPCLLSEQEIKSLFVHVERDKTIHARRNKLLIYLLYATGMRVTELITIKVKNIDWSNRCLLISGKGNKERSIPIPKAIMPLLKTYIKTYHRKFNSEYLFPVLFHGRLNHMTRQSVRVILKKLWKKTGIDKIVSPHQLRHSYATHMLQNGANIRHLQLLLGHESITSTQIYTHVDTSFLRATYEKRHPRAK